MATVIWLVVLVAFGGAVWWLTGPSNPYEPRRSSIGAGTVGTIYDLLNEEKRNAVEVIVEQRAEARDPEDAEGNLPELESPNPRS
ncbi:MAG TPA: hypothetical protein VJP86_13255 [Vicinamibacterales bacterium]|nr:hypothetical protein [Vicinamibacterales bacterium]